MNPVIAISALLLLQAGISTPKKGSTSARTDSGTKANVESRRVPDRPSSDGRGGAPQQSAPEKHSSTASTIPSVAEPIRKDLLPTIDSDEEKIVFTAQLNNDDFPEGYDAGSTSIEDATPETELAFPKRHEVSYQVTNGSFSCEVPFKRDLVRDLRYSFSFSITGRKSNAAYVLRAKGTIPHARSTWERLGLYGQIAAGLVAVCLLVALGMVTLWTTKKFRRKEEDRRARDAEEVRRRDETLRRLEEQARVQPKPVRDQELYRTSDEHNRRISALEEDRGDLDEALRRTVGNLSDLETIVGLVQARQRNVSARSGLVREAEAVIAVVNHWRNTGSTTRQQMLSLAREIGVDMKLMEHVSISRLLSDVTALNAADFSESTNNGGWLWCMARDGIGMIAPADFRLFQSAQEFSLLGRMFDGVPENAGPVEPELVMRPCQLRMKQPPFRYEIVQKGLLQFAGQHAIVAVPPTTYVSLRQPQAPEVRTVSSSTLVSVLGKLLEALANRVSGLEDGLNGLRGRSDAPMSGSRIPDLDKFVVPMIQREIQQAEQRFVQQVENRSKPSPSAVLTADPPGTSIALKQLREQVTGIKAELRDVASRLSSIDANWMAFTLANTHSSASDPMHLTTLVGSTAPSSPEQEAVGSAAVENETSGASPGQAVVTTITGDSPPELRVGLPVGWEQVVAGIRPVSGLGEKELAEGLRGMKSVLQSMPDAPAIGLVHLMEKDGHFRVHPATLNGEQVICQMCGGARTFQAAVCIGERGWPELQVLLAAGDYAQDNYPAGYRQLIQSMPSQQFRIQHLVSPAVLTLVTGASTDQYAIKYKLQWK